jgi:hypothetical protein
MITVIPKNIEDLASFNIVYLCFHPLAIQEPVVKLSSLLYYLPGFEARKTDEHNKQGRTPGNVEMV